MRPDEGEKTSEEEEEEKEEEEEEETYERRAHPRRGAKGRRKRRVEGSWGARKLGCEEAGVRGSWGTIFAKRQWYSSSLAGLSNAGD